MTDQSPNDQLRASSFIQGHVAQWLEPLCACSATKLNAFKPEPRPVFSPLDDTRADVTHSGHAPSHTRQGRAKGHWMMRPFAILGVALISAASMAPAGDVTPLNLTGEPFKPGAIIGLMSVGKTNTLTYRSTLMDESAIAPYAERQCYLEDKTLDRIDPVKQKAGSDIATVRFYCR